MFVAPLFQCAIYAVNLVIIGVFGAAIKPLEKRHSSFLYGFGWLTSCFVLAVVISYFLTDNLLLNITVSTALSLWVLAWMGIDIKEKTRNASSLWAGLRRLNMGYWGMQVAHLGILLSVMGIAITTSLSVEKDIAMQKKAKQ